MNAYLPVPKQPTDQAQQLINAVEEAFVAQQPTAHRDDTPLPAIGTTPPVPQPGRPPMSQRATDASVLMLTAGAASLMVGGGASLVMLASGYADPAVCAIAFGAPTVLVLAIGRLASKAKAVAEAAPAPVHHHYNGNVTVDQRSINTQTRGVIANTRNQLPR
ncbi:hypothetical protein OG298_45030 (plasmid) [Streptomyces sp. NBC_01005]|uniref:hypothetical protein n=1 Tax=Streptomyces sp. NBC_01005 TaxID=2903715 RepID=UPI002F9162E8|nr:hypothetical protein OG298_45030 [Streptomyces sp. NBC_01005]